MELVTESDTLRKIQMKHGRGVAGSFKDTTIREWLQLQNSTELLYEKVTNMADEQNGRQRNMADEQTLPGNLLRA